MRPACWRSRTSTAASSAALRSSPRISFRSLPRPAPRAPRDHNNGVFGMNVLLTIVLTLQMLTALGMIGLILLQHGKGADMGAAFGSGASGSLFGASGSANFLSRTTAILAAVFFACTLILAYFSHSVAPTAATGGSVLERTAPVPAAP